MWLGWGLSQSQFGPEKYCDWDLRKMYTTSQTCRSWHTPGAWQEARYFGWSIKFLSFKWHSYFNICWRLQWLMHFSLLIVIMLGRPYFPSLATEPSEMCWVWGVGGKELNTCFSKVLTHPTAFSFLPPLPTSKHIHSMLSCLHALVSAECVEKGRGNRAPGLSTGVQKAWGGMALTCELYSKHPRLGQDWIQQTLVLLRGGVGACLHGPSPAGAGGSYTPPTMPWGLPRLLKTAEQSWMAKPACLAANHKPPCPQPPAIVTPGFCVHAYVHVCVSQMPVFHPRPPHPPGQSW